ncbi:1810_t:CDS:10, partial [Dentiscutata erythropus]
ENSANVDSITFKKKVQEEQEDFMKRMTKPNMVAENFALLENVLVITVCILTRIPLFIVGAPGASKSLAVRLVFQSLRGNDSDDPYFRTLPQVYLVPHQGSSSSTSDGIVKVFNKAHNYQKGNSEEFPLITVVLLDEVGLAEKSLHNPLKVLHSLLEPNYPFELPEVAIIGISNWRFDHSKSSRALLRGSYLHNEMLLEKNKEFQLVQFKALAESYLEYKEVQPINNFHGLRDYYSLVKSLGDEELAPMALARSFGGTNQTDELYKAHFSKVIKVFHGSVDNLNSYSIEDLIKGNLKDKNARHLMIIGKSNSIVDILTYKLKQCNKELIDKESKFNDGNFDLEPLVIYGSQFPDDSGDDYQYSVLSRIMDLYVDLELLELNIIEEILNIKLDESKEFDFGNYLLKRQSDIMIDQLCKIIKKDNINRDGDDLDDKGDSNNDNRKQDKDEQYSNAYCENSSDKIQIRLQHWQRDVANILSIACNLSNLFDNPSSIELSFKNIHSSDELTVNNIFNTIIEYNEKISLVGIIITKFYLIRASRELNENEDISIQKISKYLQSSQFPDHYKTYLLNFMTNKHQLYKLRPNSKNIDVFISSVVAHVVALNISNSVNSSPLTAYMQALCDYKDTYILTCPSDELASTTNVIIANDSGTRRYQCKCGNFYFIGNCGRPDENGKYNQCKNNIGGLGHKLNEGNSSIDEKKVNRPIAVNDVQGYIIEDTFDTNYTVRSLHPASYRILHLFLHIIIGIKAHLPTTTAFINNKNIDITQYCKQHIENDWKALKSIFNCEDENLSLVIHAILSDMSQEFQQNVEKFTSPAQRKDWEEGFSQKYIIPKIENFIGTANNFRIALDKNAAYSLEINEPIKATDYYNENYLPLLWRLIKKPDLNNFRSYYMSNYENKETSPLLSIFLKHEPNLKLIQYLSPIVKFAQILSSSLSNNIERKDTRQLTFQQFINNESENDDTGKTRESLNAAFNNFATSWNCLTPHIKRYGCKELPQEIPKLDDQTSVVYGLYMHEPTDESLYISAVIEYLVQLQNDFLNDVIEISPSACQSLKFIEISDIRGSRYQLQSISLENAKLEQIITYVNVNEVFLYCQYNLKVGHGQEIYYDLYKIEAELALELVYRKKLINVNEDKMYLNAFLYHKELFNRFMTILKEIKDLIPQESIPTNNKPEISENQTELLSALEIIICFLKQTSGRDCNTFISDYIKNWIESSVMKRNNSSYKFLAGTGLQLKHIMALYELVEEHVAEKVVNFLPSKYQVELNVHIEQDILKAIDFEEKSTGIPAHAFLTALKRFIVRYLSTDSEIIKENIQLSLCLAKNDSLECWPDYVSENVIETKFPTTLLTSHA